MLRTMSDDPAAASFLDRVNTLSFPAVAGLGAAAGLLFAVLSALMVEPAPDSPPSSSPARAEEPARSPEQEREAASKKEAGGGAGGGRGAKEAGEAPPGQPAPPAEVEEEPADIALEPDVGASVEVVPTAVDDATADEAADDQPADSLAPSSPTGRTQADRDAEAKMTPDELLSAASEAYEEKRYKDAYRLATRSQRSRPRDKAQMLRGRSACRLRDQKNAREIVRSFKLGDEHRKTLRAFCKDRGVRVGL